MALLVGQGSVPVGVQLASRLFTNKSLHSAEPVENEILLCKTGHHSKALEESNRGPGAQNGGWLENQTIGISICQFSLPTVYFSPSRKVLIVLFSVCRGDLLDTFTSGSGLLY